MNNINVQTIIDSVDNGVVVLDLFGRVEVISQSLLDLLGVDKVETYFDIKALFKGVTLKRIHAIRHNILGNRVVINGQELFCDYFKQ